MPPQEPAAQRRVRTATVLLVIGRLWGSACTFSYLWLLARALDGADFGRFTFYLAVFMLLDSWVDLGTGAIAVQRTASAPQKIPETLCATRAIRAVTGVIGVLVVGGGAFLAGEKGAGWILLASFYPLTHVLELSATVYKNNMAWATPVAIRALASGIGLLCVLALLSQGVDEGALYLVGIALGSASANFALHFAARRHLARVRVPRILWRSVLRAALPLGLAGLCQQTYFYVDNLFVRAFEGQVAVGHYNIAVRLMSLAIMVGVFAAMVALPWYRREYARGELGPAVRRQAQPMFAVAGLVLGLFFFFCEELLGIFGAQFTEAASSLRWLLGAATLVYMGANLLTAVVATGRTLAVLAIASLGLATNLAGNAWLLPKHGMQGAAIATFMTEGVVAVGALVALASGGVAGLGGRAALGWLGGPAGFCVGCAVSFGLRALVGGAA